MLILWSIVLFIVIFGLIIFLHEAGHFFVAKREGMKIREFAFGFPPRLISKVKDGTRFSLNLIPLGGYVSILGEDEESDKPDSFTKQSPWSRLRVVLAGVTMNILLAWLLLTIWFWVAPLAPVADAVAVSSVAPNSAAEDAGILVNDFIIAANGTTFESDIQLSEFTAAHRGEEVTFKVRRNGNELEVPVTLGSAQDDLPLGVSIVDIGEGVPDVSPWQAPYYALLEMLNVTLLTLSFIGSLILKLFGLGPEGVSIESVSGPVGIFVFLKQTLTLGTPFVLRYAALISLAVAIFNLMPFPALDGGRAVFLVLEGLMGKRAISHKAEGWLHTIGFAFLILLIIVVTYFDVQKLG